MVLMVRSGSRSSPEHSWTSILLPLTFHFIITQAQIVTTNNFNFNQSCTHASQCNNKAGLYCIPVPSNGGPPGQGRCGCPTNSTIYDHYQGRCVGKAGHPCLYVNKLSLCPEKSRCSHQDPHRPDLYYYESRCFCDLNYLADQEGKCVLAAKYGESCSNNSSASNDSSGKRCDKLSGLKCSSKGKCTCAFGPSHQFYDRKKDKCVSYIGKRCSGFNSCVDNARCDGISVSRARAIRFGSDGRKNGTTKRPDLNLNVGRCVCNYGFTPTKDGKCLAAYRQSCSKVQICNPEDNLECLDGSCNCKSPMSQLYDHDLKRCVNLVGSKCEAREKNGCVQNSHCISGRCACMEGFSETPYRTCMLDFQKPCDNGQCNKYKGLSCKSNKKCSCIDDSLVYNSKIQACVSQVGAPCGKIAQAGDYGKDHFFIPCEPNAVCKKEFGGDASTMFCRSLTDKEALLSAPVT